MNRIWSRAGLALAGLTISSIVSGQPGGGFGQREANSRDGPEQRFSDVTLEGTWTMEFEVAFDAGNAGLEPLDYDESDGTITLRADVTLFGTQVTGRFRNPANGQFTCTFLEGAARCEEGRLVIVWPDSNQQDVADFEFVIDSIDRRRARGEARMIVDGAMRMYMVRMTKR